MDDTMQRTSNPILIIEDDEDIREALRDALEDEGYRVVTATNGKEGLEILSRIDPPCLILVDLMMPVMSGLDFLAAKREAKELTAIPVVVISAYEDLARSAQGIDGFIEKPVKLDVLLREVQKHCAGSG